MKIFRFDPKVGRKIENFGSTNFVLSGIVHLRPDARISCIHLSSNGIVGYHQAVTPQLFLVVQGAGWVRGETSDRIAITVGQAAFWEKGEWHESGTNTGLMAIVIESELLDPSEFMPMA
ncbi:MAG: cupin [Chloroflexi bacterium]|nr:cupin [Chloroflexota bacterium]